MATDKQTEANRRNAQKSTGPRTPEGKARSARNALKTGIHAELLVIYDEKAEDLEALAAEYYAEYAPVTPQERFQVDTMIQCEWYCRRYTWVEAQIMYEGPEIRIDVQRKQTTIGTDPDNERMLQRLGRRLEATRRSYKAATWEFERLRAVRLAAEAAESEVEPEPEPDADPAPSAQPAPSETAYEAIGFVPSQPVSTAPPPPVEVAIGLQNPVRRPLYGLAPQRS
jgi:hypothetical protein